MAHNISALLTTIAHAKMWFCEFVYGNQTHCSRPAERGHLYCDNHREQLNIIRNVSNHWRHGLPERESSNWHLNKVNDRATFSRAGEGLRNSYRARKRTTLVESIQSDSLLEGKTIIMILFTSHGSQLNHYNACNNIIHTSDGSRRHWFNRNIAQNEKNNKRTKRKKVIESKDDDDDDDN